MMLYRNNFGLNGLTNYIRDDDGYDNLFRSKEKRAEKQQQKEEDRADKKRRKEDKQAESQEKRELANEKRRLKNDRLQAQIEEKRAQTQMMTQAGAMTLKDPPPGPAAGKDNTSLLVAGIVGVIVIAGVGYAVMRKKS